MPLFQLDKRPRAKPLPRKLQRVIFVRPLRRAARLGSANEAVPPTIENISPLPGTIGSQEPLTFEIRDASGLARVFIWVSYGGGIPDELAYDGLTFRSFYQGSTRQPLSGSEPAFRFTLRRQGGWPASPQVEADAVDNNGNPV